LSRTALLSPKDARPADRSPGWAVRLLRAALQSLLLAAVALFFLNLNVYGTATPSKRFSQDLVYAWFGNEAWLYPRPGRDTARPTAVAAHPRASDPPVSRVVVVIIGERALALRGAHWPVPIAFHAQLLSELAVLRPRAILLDFLLLDPASRQDTCDLLTVGTQLRHDGTALYLAVTGATDLAPLDAAGCRDGSGALLRARDVFTAVSVPRQADGSDFVNRSYPFEQRADGTPPGSGLATAAVRIYCDTERSPNRCVARLTAGQDVNAGFELAWSPEGDPFNQRWSQVKCRQKESPVRAVLNQPALPRESPCPPVPTLFAEALLSPTEDPALGAGNEELFRIADGSFLLVGGNFRGSGDLVTTPLHTLLPGVYYHAVALENLLAFHGDPKVRKAYRSPRIAFYAYDLLVLWLLAAIFQWRQRWLERLQAAGRGAFELSAAARAWMEPLLARCPTPLWVLGVAIVLLLLATFSWLQLIAVVATILTLVAVELRVAPAAEIRVRARALLLYVFAMALSLVVIALAIWIGYRWLRLPPGDWLGYLSFAAFGFFVAHAAIVEFGRRVDELYLERTTRGDVA
jgi:CHASE2 domain